MTPTSVKVQIAEASVPSTPSWLGEVAIVAHVFTQFDLISAIAERVRFARARFGTYDVIDFVVVLLGYAVSGERTREDFYERLGPFGQAFMALFGRAHLPSDSALSRFLAAVDQPTVEAVRTLFQEDLVARQSSDHEPGGLWDRQGKHWLVTDVDGTRATARQRALPHTPDLPAPHRRMDLVCAPGYPGRKRGEVVRTRTTVLQAHTDEWLGTFGGSGNGDYRGELLRAIQVVISYAKAQSMPLSSVLIRLDGLYGNAAPVTDILTAGLGVIVRGKDYALLDRPSVQARLAQPPDEVSTHAESGTSRALFDCLDVPLTEAGPCVRMIVASHPASSPPSPVGVTRNGMVYEIFFTSMPPQAFTAADVLHLYLHRGSFETVLSDEDQEQDPDRWVSHTPYGQEFWQILSQWVWNIRRELGLQLSPTPMRLTEFAPVQEVSSPQTVIPTQEVSPVLYGPPQFARPSYTRGFPGSAFSLQSDGTLRCPAGHPLYSQERRPERNGSLRILYAARICHCRPCPLREQCQGHGTVKPRRVSAVMFPISSHLSAPVESVPIESPSAPIETASGAVEPAPPLVEPVSVPIESPPNLAEPAPSPVEPVLIEASSASVEPALGAVEPVSVPIESPPNLAEPAPSPVEPVLIEAPSASVEPALGAVEPAPPLVEPVSVPIESLSTPVEPPTPCPVLWGDWPRSQIRRRWLKLLRTETVILTIGAVQLEKKTEVPEQSVQTRAQRAHWRLSWSERLARNARWSSAPPLEVTIHGLPASFARAFSINIVAAA